MSTKTTAKKSTKTPAAAASTRGLDPRLPKQGVANKRTYHEVDYTWKVINEHGGIKMTGGKLKAGGEEFISVSSAAKRLTGSETNGYAFFGLLGDKPKAAKKAKAAKPAKKSAKAKGGKAKKAGGSKKASKANSAAAPTAAESTATASE